MADEYNPFRIDQANLDEEWRRMPGLTRKACTREADARHEHAQAKARLEVIEAELKLAIRRDPEKYGLEKDLKVAELAAAVTIQKGYQQAQAELNEAKHTLDIMSADVAAMVDRRKCLERLVELLAIEFYSNREPRERSKQSREFRDDRSHRRTFGEGVDFDPNQQRTDDGTRA